MPVIGTAGHVDHGKSSLVQALTGRDPDRWTEEKERGLTLDLGFAWLSLDDGGEVSFVDVPGHHRFIKNMLAGVEGIDVALLVVAADEGWMPQSEEHANVLDGLGIDRGVVALTKMDKVDNDTLELCQLEVEEQLEGLSLSGFPIVPVSALTGRGLDELRLALSAQISQLKDLDQGRPRLWVDRSFVVSGAGSVITGTLLGGTVSVGDTLNLWPGNEEVRVRSVQTHERAVELALPGRRVALNISGMGRSEITRGAMLGKPEHWTLSSRILVSLKLARYVEQISDRGAYHLHVGSSSQPVKLHFLTTDPPQVFALARFGYPLPLTAGDRLIIREVGRQRVIAGGRVLDPTPPGWKHLSVDKAQALLTAVDAPDQLAEWMLKDSGIIDPQVLSQRSGGGIPDTAPQAGLLVAAYRLEEIRSTMLSLVQDFHQQNPLRAGIAAGELAQKLSIPAGLVSELVQQQADLSEQDGLVARTGFADELSEQDLTRWRETEQQIRAAGLLVPSVSELSLSEDLVHALVRQSKLVRIGSFVFLPEQITQMLEVMARLGEDFTVSEFRQQSGISRKYAVPVLEWMDRQGKTIRSGDRRRLRH